MKLHSHTNLHILVASKCVTFYSKFLGVSVWQHIAFKKNLSRTIFCWFS